MISWATLCIDAGHNGRLAGQHFEQAQFDIEAAEAMHAIRLAMTPDRNPEETVCSYFNALWANPRASSYRVKEPFTPFPPEPGIPLAERARRQALACFHAVTEGYTPIPLSESEAVAALRAEIRVAQLEEKHPAFLKLFRQQLKLT